jgi:hypothetical protein
VLNLEPALPASPLVLPAGADVPSWTDKLEAWATLAGAGVAFLAAAFTLALLVFEIRQARAARREAAQERAEAAEDRELARQDREFAAAERRDEEAAQARAITLGTFSACPVVHSSRSRFAISLTVSNHSSEPILDVAVLLELDGGERWRYWAADILGPTSERRIEETYEPTPEIRLLEGSYPVLLFTDVHGRRWSRRISNSPDRVLERVAIEQIRLVYDLENFE